MRWLIAGLIGMGASADAWAAFDVYLEYPGIPGDVLAQGYQNQIEATSLTLSGFRVAEIGNVAGIGNAKLAEVTFTKGPDSATPLLFLGALQGVPSAQDAVFRFQSPGPGQSVPFLIVTLKRPIVTGFSVEGASGDDVPTESVTLAYDEICVAHQPFNTSGQPSGAPVETCWNANTQTGG